MTRSVIFRDSAIRRGYILNDQFTGLPPEKRERIINAALKEFASGGYDKASTNAICRGAEISKGSLFLYFGNKKNLFLQLFEYCEAQIAREVDRGVDPACKDLLERYRQMHVSFAGLLKRFPILMDFVMAAKRDESSEIAEEIKKIKQAGTEALDIVLLKDADMTLFREDLDRDTAIFVINSALHMKLSAYIRRDMTDEELLFESEGLLDFFRTAFYRF